MKYSMMSYTVWRQKEHYELTRILDLTDAWNSRATGRVPFGLGHAIVGRNRRWVDTDGVGTMCGDTNTPKFSHIEGYEDHTVGVLATRDGQDQLTGLVVNVPCPSQVKSRQFQISADYWYEILFGMIEGKPGRNVILPPKLIRRQTT